MTFKFLHESICCDPSFESSHRDGSNEGSQHMFALRNKNEISLNLMSGGSVVDNTLD